MLEKIHTLFQRCKDSSFQHFRVIIFAYISLEHPAGAKYWRVEKAEKPNSSGRGHTFIFLMTESLCSSDKR